MRKVTLAAVQMRCSKSPKENLDKAEALVRQAAARGASVILLPGLFERLYFCQERRYDYYAWAAPAEKNPAVARFASVARELGTVLPVSFFEKDGNRLFNSAAILDADGSLLGVYRKTHIPDDHYYQEKIYFTPGDTGVRVWETAYGRVGVGICWDQWFPETARAFAVNGAEMLLYPTAIGSEPILTCDSLPPWPQTGLGWRRWSPAGKTAASPPRFLFTAPLLLRTAPGTWRLRPGERKRQFSRLPLIWTPLKRNASIGESSATAGLNAIR